MERVMPQYIPGTYMRAKWRLRATYKDTATKPRTPGGLAVEVVVADDSTRDFELKTFERREPGYAVDVEVTRCDDGYYGND